MTQSADKLMIEELTKERDALALGIDQWRVDHHELRLEYNALAAAAKLALDALSLINDSHIWLDKEHRTALTESVKALRQVGVK